MNDQANGGGDGPHEIDARLGVGSRIGAYRLEQVIGRGGMAVVFRAVDERLDRQVAVKILAPVVADDDAFRQRFMRESRVAAAVDDPHIIPIFEAGESGGVLFIAMRYVQGGDVRTLVRRHGPLTPARAAAILSPMASALDTAHAAGLVHRDVKPANMLLDVRPDRPDHVYLTDFGLSKNALASIGLTDTGLLVGTPDYVAPEQITGGVVDGRTDQYSLACTAFELLSGSPPFQRDHGMAVIYAHTSEPPPPLTALRADLSPDADAVLAKAMSKSREDRYANCRDFGESLRAALGQPPYHAEYSGATKKIVGRPPDPLPSDDGGTTVTPPPRPMTGETEPGSESAGVAGRSERRRRKASVMGIGIGAAVLAGVGATGIILHARGSPGNVVMTGHHSTSSTHNGRPPVTAPFAPIPGSLHAVAVSSATSGWAVGQDCISGCGTTGEINRTVILHWNGHKWSRVASPNKGGGAELRAIGPVRGSSAWAVGNYCASSCGTKYAVLRALILYWNGSAWTQAASPTPGTSSWLSALSVAKGGDAWAVGGFTKPIPGSTSTSTDTLILHLHKSIWKQIRNPSPGSRASLFGVSTDPQGDAWAVGRYCVSSCFTSYEIDRPLISHWNSTSWSLIHSPDPAGNSDLYSVSVGQANNVWAVGSSCVSVCYMKSKINRSLIMHWDGGAWTQIPSPSPPSSSWLEGVTASPSGKAWAVGGTCVSACGTTSESDRALIMNWNGRAWSTVANPGDLGKHPSLYSLSSAPPDFVVGRFCVSACFSRSEHYRTLILHWNGAAFVRG
jgi:serine/threonine protein kinase